MNYIRDVFFQAKRLIIQYLVILLQRCGFLLPSISVDGNCAIIWFYDENQEWDKVYVPYNKYGSTMTFKTEKGPRGILKQHPNIPILLTDKLVGKIMVYDD